MIYTVMYGSSYGPQSISSSEKLTIGVNTNSVSLTERNYGVCETNINQILLFAYGRLFSDLNDGPKGILDIQSRFTDTKMPAQLPHLS